MLRLLLITLMLISGFIGISSFSPLATVATGTASASCATTDPGLCGDACQGLTQLDSSNGCGTGGKAVDGILHTVVNVLSYVVGIIAIIVVIISGLKYITSGGDSNKVSGAKTTLLYALVGIAIAALAQFLVHFVLVNATTTNQ